MPLRPQKRRVDVRVFPFYKKAAPAASVRRAATTALALADPDGSAGASVVVADDETLRDLNLRFRGFDEVTDVLSFGEHGAPMEDTAFPPSGQSSSVGFPLVPDAPSSLGEVVLSYPMAERQAREHNVPVEREAALLIVHGILHLLGHDHAKPEEEAAMRAIEQRALSALFPSANGTGAC
ncbi:MAG: rRNA maturation RNase YbeY [Chloroflexota bacterium]|nr:rRNA maturation RNase YbeY [Chloroflexota bacterium]MDE2886372.1 rRNA maturation RNase YbeY [Chloroflexota bacterium]